MSGKHSAQGEHDVVVVGAGINGLTCAAYLARAGKRVLVLEANPDPGGFIRTDEIPGAPGFKMNSYGIEFPFVHIKPSVYHELGLGRFGLRFAEADPMNGFLSPHGTHWIQHRSLKATYDSIARLSRRDAAKWSDFMTSLTALLDVGLPYLTDHPTRPSPQTVVEILKHAARNRRSLLPATRYMLQSAREIVEGYETEEMRAYIAMNVVTGSFQPLDEIGNTSILVYFAFNHKYGIMRPIGGAGAFTDALVQCIEADGGEVHTSAPVAQITVKDGRTTGVVLHDGEEIRAGEVVATCDPTSLFTKLLEPSVVPPSLQEEVGEMRVLSKGISHMVANVAVSRRPTFPGHAGMPDGALCGLSFSPDVPYVDRMWENVKAGVLGEEQGFYLAVPSIKDRSLVPEGSDGESVFFWVGAVPIELADGSNWQEAKHQRFNHIMDKLETYSPGFKDSIVGYDVRCPEDLNAEWVHKGSSRSVDLIPSQMGPWRPSPSLAGYETPGIEGLWRSGHGTHPMSGTNAWPGRLAARTMLGQAGQAPLRVPARLRSLGGRA